MGWIALALLMLVVYAVSKWVTYYGATLGLLYYLGTKHGDLPSAEKTKELRDAALQRRVKELIGRKDA